MKKLLFLLPLFVLALTFTSCEDDPIVPEITDGILSYDGPNNTAPSLNAGVYEAAARFTPAITEQFEGKNLEEVSFYLVELPIYAEVRIYGRGRSNEPGDLLYSADVTDSMNANNWNDHILTNPVQLDGRDLWIAVYLEHSGPTRSIGCDSGPAINNAGDWLYEESDGNWLTFTERSSASINWNIRGAVEQ